MTLTGIVPSLFPYYADCDLVVIPSLSEGIPITLQEALAFSKPVLCSKLLGTYEYGKSLKTISKRRYAEARSRGPRPQLTKSLKSIGKHWYSGMDDFVGFGGSQKR